MMHAPASHHTHATAVASKPAVHPGQESAKARVSLLLGLLGQLPVPRLDVVLLQGSGSGNLNTYN